MLTPIQQFVCDSCGQLIEKPEDGWFEWLENTKTKAYGFRIVHHLKSCQYSGHPSDLSDTDLVDVLGPNGLPKLYRFIDAGPMHDPKRTYVPEVRDLREFMEILRRLTIPYYEEARLYWNDAKHDNYFDGANEVWIYLPKNLKNLIKKYGNENNLE